MVRYVGCSDNEFVIYYVWIAKSGKGRFRVKSEEKRKEVE